MKIIDVKNKFVVLEEEALLFEDILYKNFVNNLNSSNVFLPTGYWWHWTGICQLHAFLCAAAKDTPVR